MTALAWLLLAAIALSAAAVCVWEYLTAPTDPPWAVEDEGWDAVSKAVEAARADIDVPQSDEVAAEQMNRIAAAVERRRR
jgi:alcohol dehydrogenase class IV